MTEMEPHDIQIDTLLRSSMAAPIPGLPSDFDQRLMRELHRTSQPLDRYRWILLTGYGLTSAVASAVVMHSQRLSWGTVAVMLVGSFALAATAPWTRRAIHPTTQHSA